MATIAIVDDSTSIRKIFEYYLQDVGHQVVLAATGTDGLKLITEQRVDVALIDANMPGLHGVDLCAALKANPATQAVPVVIMTACVSQDLVARALAAGALEVLAKPFDVVAVEETLRRYAEAAAGSRDRNADSTSALGLDRLRAPLDLN
jgi:CheY-like chemotaxis protein